MSKYAATNLQQGRVTTDADTNSAKSEAGLRSDGELVQAVTKDDERGETIVFAGKGDEDWATADDLMAAFPDDEGCTVDDASLFGDDKPIIVADFGDEMPEDLPAG